MEIFIGRLFSNISCRLTWIKRKVPFSDVRTTNNIKALNLKGDDFRVDGAFVLLRVPAGEAPRAVPKWRGRYQFMKAGGDPASVAHGRGPTCHARDVRLDPWVRKVLWGRECSPLQYSHLENPTDGGAWRATVQRVSKSRTQLKSLRYTQ